MVNYESIDKLISTINTIVKKVNEGEFEKELLDQVGMENIPAYVETFEKDISSLLRTQRSYYINQLKKTVIKAEKPLTIEELFQYYSNDFFIGDDFRKNMSKKASKFLTATTKDISKTVMKSLDKDVSFQRLSGRSVSWIKEWSEDLASLMKISTQSEVEGVLIKALSEGKGIQHVELALKDLPAFDRKRARTTAITEVLTAASVAQQEAFEQSPAVEGKKWKHSGSKGIEPRESHIELSGTVVPVDEQFAIPGSGELAEYPRDTELSASERIHCHCVMGPAVNEDILGWTKDDKEEAREVVMNDLDKNPYTKKQQGMEKIKANAGKKIKGEKDILDAGKLIYNNIESKVDFYSRRIKRLDVLNEKATRKYFASEMSMKEHTRFVNTTKKLKERAAEKRVELIFLELKKIRNFGEVTIDNILDNSDLYLKQILINSRNYFPTSWITESNKNSVLLLNLTNNRGSQQLYKGVSIISAGTSETKSTIIHEMMHHFESSVPGFLAAEKLFYERRTKGYDLVQLGYPYDEQEVARLDKFVIGYIGKDYAGTGYEIMSVGLQEIMEANTRIYRDTDYIHFILGMLARL
ncbi:hypothetical protein M0910_002535 [Listeria monocytogenes]|nr:hypothetical protein [Listeria monocytogenes]EJA0931491.1 hypothetical protein [Listeria monocytogenes]EJA1052987.1 hypothetical protein [Listeria monocytogenes]EJA1073694.1 hypothetical protein [Listeria monocytogenes]EJC8830515.1 hypothetical protein [Listeria monocytogenes]